MNAHEQVSLAAVSIQGVMADDADLIVDEYYSALHDMCLYLSQPWIGRLVNEAEGYWYQFEVQACSEYAAYMLETRLGPSVALAKQMTTDWANHKLRKPEVEELRGLNRGLDKWRTTYRRQREAELRAEVQAWERAVLARLGKRASTAVVAVVEVKKAA
jgi:hypothetical protein